MVIAFPAPGWHTVADAAAPRRGACISYLPGEALDAKMAPMPSDNPPTRQYSCTINGQEFSQSFRHADGLPRDTQEKFLDRQFHQWLLEVAPTAYERGLVQEIKFADGTEMMA
jgi:hypothetical protein